jgi:hypothetical protein
VRAAITLLIVSAVIVALGPACGYRLCHSVAAPGEIRLVRSLFHSLRACPDGQKFGLSSGPRATAEYRTFHGIPATVDAEPSSPPCRTIRILLYIFNRPRASDTACPLARGVELLGFLALVVCLSYVTIQRALSAGSAKLLSRVRG